MASDTGIRWLRLKNVLAQEGRALVAFSGGTDSALVLCAARQALGKDKVLAVTAISPSIPRREAAAAREVARSLDVWHLEIETDEMKDASYTSNPPNRCFYCKSELFAKLAPIAIQRQMTVVDGFNTSDRADFRPGFEAAAKWGVRHPLDEVGLEKKHIRALSRWQKLKTWSKPASPCLSSRIPYGSPVTVDVLQRIERAEEVVRSERFPVVRVRHYDREARVEVPLSQIGRLTSPEMWRRISKAIEALGFEKVTADLEGFRSGKLNDSLQIRQSS